MNKTSLATALLALAAQVAVAQTFTEWHDPAVNAVNRAPMHATYSLSRVGSHALRLSLNGLWRFNYVENATDRPTTFYKTDYDDRRWAQIAVPAVWQLSGYGAPQYINNGYAWRNQFNSNPPQVPSEGNHVGSYRRTIAIPSAWKGRDIIMHIGSATAAMYVWVNGKYVGYSEDSKLEAEFDITRYCRPGQKAVIALQVFRWADGTYLEDQDFFRYNGLARDCYLTARTTRRIEDLRVTPDLDATYRNATLAIALRRKGTGRVTLTLADREGKTVAEATTNTNAATLSVTGANTWSAETPYLYTLRATMEGTDEVIEQRVGLRKIELRGAQVLVNGKAVLFKGADRHELDPDGGYVVSRERMLQDIRLMKELNINAVRTCHYPDDALWYDLCDEYGIYMVAEANIESHGMGYGKETLARRDDFRKAHLERNERNVARNFNHPAIIFWSLGNEAGYGPNFEAAYDLVRRLDPSRPVQFEQAGREGKTDIFCPMYYGYKACEDYCKDDRYQKPLIQCEYAHAMGNSEGGFREYWDLVRRYPKYQGGFIWDFVDQSPRKTGKSGATVYGYGGDWNRYDAGDGNFCDNGLVSPDRVPNPHAWEVQRVYQSVLTTLAGYKDGTARLRVYNENFFSDLLKYYMEWTLLSDGHAVQSGRIERLDIKPQEAKEIAIDGLSATGGELLLNVAYKLRDADGLLAAGFAVAKEQLLLNGEREASASRDGEREASASRDFREADASRSTECGTSSLHVTDNDYNWLIIAGDAARFEFSRHTGFLSLYEVGGRPMIKDGSALTPNFWRAPTDNDYGAGLQRRYALWREPEMKLTSLTHEAKDADFIVTATYTLTQLDATLTLTYTLHPSGTIDVTEDMQTTGKDKPAMFRFGMQMTMPESFEHIEYYGRGPWENYADRKTSADLGIYRQTVSEQFYPYIRPQENGTKTDIRWWHLSEHGMGGLMITAEKPFSASALHYSIASLDDGPDKRLSHSPEVAPIDGTNVCIDLAQTGLGCEDSWGRITRPEYQLPYAPRTFRFTLRPLR